MRTEGVRVVAIAGRSSVSMLMTSLVDFISGPRYVSTPGSFDMEKTGALTLTIGGSGWSPPE